MTTTAGVTALAATEPEILVAKEVGKGSMMMTMMMSPAVGLLAAPGQTSL